MKGITYDIISLPKIVKGMGYTNVNWTKSIMAGKVYTELMIKVMSVLEASLGFEFIEASLDASFEALAANEVLEHIRCRRHRPIPSSPPPPCPVLPDCPVALHVAQALLLLAGLGQSWGLVGSPSPPPPPPPPPPPRRHPVPSSPTAFQKHCGPSARASA
eukprot:COSAG01_NODE_12664_length_1702_cov_3.660012_3_plen_160_part_00